MKMFLVLLAVLTANAQLRISRVNRHTLSNGAVITFKNFGDVSVNASGYRIGSDGQHIPINSTPNNSFETGGSGPIIPAGGEWSVDYTPWASQGSSSGKFSQSSDISLWRSNNYLNTSNLIDFIQYCNTGRNGDITCPNFGEYARAIYAGIWTEGTFVNYTGPIGVMMYTGNGTTRGAEEWSSSTTTTSSTASSYASTSSSDTTTSSSTIPMTTATTTSDDSRDTISCQEIAAEMYTLHFRLIQLQARLGC